jgi:carbon monoxide dehydrogenase subunit G
MKVKLDKSFPMPGSADAAWVVLGNLERVAACMPGAKLVERTDERRYKGTVAVRFGPANLTFRGEVEVLGHDDAARSLQLSGKGTDTSGGSGASMELAARIEPVDASSCTLAGTAEVSMSGKAAAFGARLAVPVADQVLQQFATNFAAQVRDEQARRAATAAAPDPGVPASAAAGAASAPSAQVPAAGAAPADPGAAVAPAAPLSGPALLWAVLKSWLRGLFGGRARHG